MSNAFTLNALAVKTPSLFLLISINFFTPFVSVFTYLLFLHISLSFVAPVRFGLLLFHLLALLHLTRQRHFPLVLPEVRTYHGAFSILIATELWSYIKIMSWDPVYRLVQRIPRGKVLTYGGLAKVLGLPGGARTAGRAMAATPSGKGIPWHRVIGDRGEILIRGPHALLQRKLLESEGVALVEFRVDLKRHLWKPSRPAKSKPATQRKKARK